VNHNSGEGNILCCEKSKECIDQFGKSSTDDGK